jgi:D-serine deaminase-like pyridoxal phosphate-dependent protein
LVEGDEPATNRAIVDAGLKTLAFDSGDSGPPRAFDEHRRAALLAATNRFGLGDKIRLGPCYCDPTVNRYDRSVCVRDNRVKWLWPITAAGTKTTNAIPVLGEFQ